MTPPPDVVAAADRLWLGVAQNGDAAAVSGWCRVAYRKPPANSRTAVAWVKALDAERKAVTRWGSVKEWLKGRIL